MTGWPSNCDLDNEMSTGRNVAKNNTLCSFINTIDFLPSLRQSLVWYDSRSISRFLCRKDHSILIDLIQLFKDVTLVLRWEQYNSGYENGRVLHGALTSRNGWCFDIKSSRPIIVDALSFESIDLFFLCILFIDHLIHFSHLLTSLQRTLFWKLLQLSKMFFDYDRKQTIYRCCLFYMLLEVNSYSEVVYCTACTLACIPKVHDP